MTTQRKKSVYLHRLSQTQRAASAVRNSQSNGLYFCPRRCDYDIAVCKPRDLIIMVWSALCEGLSSGKWRTAFIVPQCLKFTTMENSKKTVKKTANTITFKADWLDFTEHLTNAQFCRLARCVARFSEGNITPAHVAELRKDAAVGVAYNFITDQLERMQA